MDGLIVIIFRFLWPEIFLDLIRPPLTLGCPLKLIASVKGNIRSMYVW